MLWIHVTIQNRYLLRIISEQYLDILNRRRIWNEHYEFATFSIRLSIKNNKIIVYNRLEIPIFTWVVLSFTHCKFHLSDVVSDAFSLFYDDDLIISSKVITFSSILFFLQIIPGNGSASFFFQIWKLYFIAI